MSDEMSVDRALNLVASYSQDEREDMRLRNKSIVLARSLNATFREIAAAAGMSHAGVAKVVEKFSDTELTK